MCVAGPTTSCQKMPEPRAGPPHVGLRRNGRSFWRASSPSPLPLSFVPIPCLLFRVNMVGSLVCLSFSSWGCHLNVGESLLENLHRLFAISLCNPLLICSMSYMLPHLHSGWEVDQAILTEEDRVVVIRFGRDSDPTCMIQDEGEWFYLHCSSDSKLRVCLCMHAK